MNPNQSPMSPFIPKTLAGMGYSNQVEGTGGINLGQIPSTQSFIQGQFGAEDPSLQALIEKMQGREDPLAMYARLEAEQGLPPLRQSGETLSKEIANLEDSYYRLEPDISARTRESIVTEPQRRAMLAEGRRPITEGLTRMGTSLSRIWDAISRGESTLGTKVGLGIKGQEMQLEPYQLTYDVMVDRNARLLSGFSADNETLLNSLYDKLQQNRHLDDREWQKAFELEKMKQEYDYKISEYDYKRKNQSAAQIANSIPGFWD